jgi:hypothetical protein
MAATFAKALAGTVGRGTGCAGVFVGTILADIELWCYRLPLASPFLAVGSQGGRQRPRSLAGPFCLEDATAHSTFESLCVLVLTLLPC